MSEEYDPEKDPTLQVYENLYISHLLYPQYEKYYRTIPRHAWEIARIEAFKLLAESRHRAAPQVLAHWEGIAAGMPPFGLTIREDSER